MQNRISPTFEHLFTNINRGHERFRVLTSQCQQTINALGNLNMLWVICGLVQVGVIVDSLRILPQVLSVFLFGFFGVLYATCYAIKNRRILLDILVYSLVNLLAYITICIIIICFQSKKLLYPTLLYFSTETLLTLWLIEDRNKFFPKFLLMLQLLIIVLKLDNQIKTQWIQVYFGFILAFFVTVVVVISMFVFWVVNVMLYRQRVFSIKHIGIGFIIMNSLSGTFLSMLPISQTFFRINIIKIGICAIIFDLACIMYTVRYKSELILFMCKVERIKEYNQMITLVKIPQESINQYVFIRRSENWYERIKRDVLVGRSQDYVSQLRGDDEREIGEDDGVMGSIVSMSARESGKGIESQKKQIFEQQQIIQQNETQQHQQPQQPQPQPQQTHNRCLVCLELKANIIWMPCGHLTVCQICCDRILQNRSCNCLLCKDIPQALYQIINDTPPPTSIKNRIVNQNKNKNQKDNSTSGNIHSSKTIDNETYNSNPCWQDTKLVPKQQSTKDLDIIQASLSGNVLQKNGQNQNCKQKEKQKQKYGELFRKYKDGFILTIKYAFSIRIQ